MKLTHILTQFLSSHVLFFNLAAEMNFPEQVTTFSSSSFYRQRETLIWEPAAVI